MVPLISKPSLYINEFDISNLPALQSDLLRGNRLPRKIDCWFFDYPQNESLNGLILSPEGIIADNKIFLCSDCANSLTASDYEMPKHALANNLYHGPVPDELACLTYAEKHVIARARFNNPIIKLSDGISQRGLNGHFIFHLQNPDKLANTVPINLQSGATEIQVVLVYSRKHDANCPKRQQLDQSTPPPEQAPKCTCTSTRSILEKFKRQLKIRPLVVKRAITWLQNNNAAWSDVMINDDALKSYKNENALFDQLSDRAQSVHDSQQHDSIAEASGVVTRESTNLATST
jgi:hypothetical protein